jgi:hypothetical protein
MTETYEFKRLKAIFEGDGSDIREQFIFAGLLLTIFERFKKYVVEQVDGFFSNHFNIIDGKLQYTRGEKFNKLIKEKGGHLPGQHANKEFRATLHWFYDLDAITEYELNSIERIYTLRNDIGHEMFHIIADDNKHPIKLDDVLITFSVYLKIVRWWVKEVEATTDPDFDQGKYDSTNWDEVESIDTVFLREIILKSLVSDEIEKLGILCYKTRGPKSTTAAVRAI